MFNCRSSIPTLLCLALPQLLRVPVGTAETENQPMVLRNLSPLYANLGVPVMASARLPAAGGWSSDLQLQIASHALREREGESLLELDGETRRLDFALAYSPDDRLRLRVNLPWMSHGGGRLDSLIDSWHDTFGLPDGPRDEQPQDRLLFAYAGHGEQWVLDDGSGGLGDIEFTVDWSLHRSTHSALSAFASIKLPTGDESDFTGNGETAVAAGLRLYRAACLFERLSCHAQFGAAEVGDNPLDTRADRWVPFYGVSLSWSLFERLSLLAQIEGQGVLYQSAPLDHAGAPVLGALGARWKATERWEIEALFSEDLNVGSAPDITFQLGIRHVW